MAIHSRGFVGSILWRAGKLYSGGKDGNVIVTDTTSMEQMHTIEFGNLIRAIDVSGAEMAVGLRNGTIYRCGEDGSNKKIVMESHSDGEVWGLAVTGSTVLTSADDNKIKVYDTVKHTCIASGKVTDEVRKVKMGASSLSKFPASKCSRAIAINTANGHVAIGCNDGYFRVRESVEAIDTEIYSDRNSKQWIEAIAYSPDGSMIAVGSHDNKIRVYDVNNGYALLGTCSSHRSFITSVDWSLDGTQLRSVCGAHELLFFNIPDCSQNKNGASANTGTEWATSRTKYSWSTSGIIPKGQDGTHINGVEWSHDKTLIATGDDWGLVNVFRNPALIGHKPKTLRGHSEHVVRVCFNEDDSILYSIGGYDQTLMQWKRA